MVSFSYTERLPKELSSVLFEEQIKKVIRKLEHTSSDLSIVVTGDDAIRKLNKEYRNHNAATDVLSFEHGDIDPDTGNNFLGDVIISLDRAKDQSDKKGHSLHEEIVLLTIHGILHLLGYKHSDPKEEETMFALQDELLRDTMSMTL